MRLPTCLTLCVLLTSLPAASALAKEGYVRDLTWGSNGSGDYQFNGNIGLSISRGHVCVADTGNSSLKFFDRNGVFVHKFGTFGLGRGQFLAARQVVQDELLNYYVVDSQAGLVSVFDVGYVLGNSWGQSGSADRIFNVPWRIAINRQSNMLYIADTMNKRISQWTTGGAFVRVFGAPSSASTQYPRDLAIDPTGNVYAADTTGHRVQKFSQDGVLQGQFLIGSGGLGSPVALAAGPDGSLFVGDAARSMVGKYVNGVKVTEFGGNGTGPGQFQWLDSIAVDELGYVFVGDGCSVTSRIQRFQYNRWPTAPTTVAITPRPPHDSDDLIAKPIGAIDPDGESLTFRYQWFRSTNGVQWVKGPAKRILKDLHTSVGDYWRVRVVAFDGKSCSPAKVSAAVRIIADPAPAMTAVAQPAGAGVALTVNLAAAGDVQVTVNNLAGRQIAQLPPTVLRAGVSTLHWNRLTGTGTKAPAGRYLLRATAKGGDGRQSSATCWLTLR